MLVRAAALEIAGLVVQCVTAAAALTLAFIGLRMNAKPGIRVRVHRTEDPAHRNEDPVVFAVNETDDCYFFIYVELGRFVYGKPTASAMELTVNIQEPWDLQRLSWIAEGPRERDLSERGEGKGLKPPPRWARRQSEESTGVTHFLVADGIWLTREEKGVTLKVTLRAPGTPVTHHAWVQARAKEGDCGVHRFRLECRG